jgi:pyridoxamine 5'-phosphate oxidase
MNVADLRIDYRRGQLRRGDLQADPIEQFRHWFETACAAGVIEPSAMSLATAGSDGQPRVRTVLLKGFDSRGFVFFTNLESRKGRQIGENAWASLLFPWLALERQVIVSGRAAQVSMNEAQAYFASRPRASQLAAWASAQSRPLANREALEAELEKVRVRFGAEPATTAAGETQPLTMPPFWGGYRVVPERVEFWQGRASRLHDRFEYTRRSDSSWAIERLAP